MILLLAQERAEQLMKGELAEDPLLPTEQQMFQEGLAITSERRLKRLDSSKRSE